MTNKFNKLISRRNFQINPRLSSGTGRGGRRGRTSYITFKFRTSLNIKRILSAFYAPLPLSKIFLSRPFISTNRTNTGSKSITSNLQYKLENLEKRADIILYRAH
mgnify:FL=1